MRILNIEPKDYSTEAKKILNEMGDYSEQEFLSKSELIKAVRDKDVIITRFQFPIDQEILSAASCLKMIGSATTGLDHIDLVAAAAKNIRVVSLKGEQEFLRSIPATAELTWGLILSLTRRIPWALNATAQGEWNRDFFRGRDLYSKHLSILGLGRIGEKIAKYGIAFGMKVSAFDPFRSGWVEGVDRVSDLKELISRADIFSIHIPLTRENENFVGLTELNLLSKNSYLINTSRGKILDERSLLKKLAGGEIAGAALDVLSDEFEKKRETFELLRDYAKQNQNLILTPHIGGASIDSMQSTEVFIAKKIAEIIRTS